MVNADRRQLGQKYEALACSHLQSRGLGLIEQNFLCKMGELDLIMREQECIVFVEVRYRQQTAFGHAAESVDYRKQQKLIKTAHLWLKKQGLSPWSTEYRFDVVAIHQHGRQVEWIQNAITQG